LLKRATKRALLGLGIHKLKQALNPHHLVILRYHSVRDENAELEPYMPVGITHSTKNFRAQMEYVAKTCKPMSLDEAVGYMDGSNPIPERSVLVSFDDGFRDNYEIAAPILEHYGVRGTFYVCSSSVEGRPLWIVRLRYWSAAAGVSRAQFLEASARCASLSEPEREEFLAKLEHANSVRDSFTMTWAQARDLIQRGHTIGSHTVNHPNAARISSGELTRELEASKKILETKLSTTISHFAYPNPILEPHWNQSTIELSRRAGYKTAVTSTSGAVGKDANLLALPRQPMAHDFTDFVWDLETAFSGDKR
jgi:peptidoglycan/xylan/chitin deacetylase (PgdA/CDA1 family)